LKSPGRAGAAERRPQPQPQHLLLSHHHDHESARDVSFTEFLLPSQSPPTGKGWGVYAYSSRTQTLRAVMAPGVKPGPDGSIFAGAYYHDDLNDRGQVSFSGIFPPPTASLANPSGLGPGCSVRTPTAAFTR